MLNPDILYQDKRKRLKKLDLFHMKEIFFCNEMKDILKIAKRKILILDGAMGTMIQRHNLNEDDFRKN